MKRSICAMAAAIGLGQPAASVDQPPPPRTPPSAVDFVVEAVGSLCRSEGDKLEDARRLVARGWRLTDTADHYDKEFGVDAPVPLQDQHERGWRGPLADGQASLSIDTVDHRDPALRDHFSATLTVAPESAIDLDALQRRLGMTMRPQGQIHVGRSSDYSALVVNGQPGPVIPRRHGQMQHFTLEPAPAGIEIEATRTWGAGFPEQWIRIRCSRRFERDPG